jgi:hypothetical protein
MTEINIERKERRSIWPWLLAAALLALLIVFMRNRGPDETVAGTRADSAAVNTSTGDVSRDTAGGARRP